MTETDSAGDQQSMPITWTITDFDPLPVFTSVPDTQSNVASDAISSSLAISASASAPDGEGVTYSLSNQPGGLSIDATTGVISGNVNSSDGGVYDVHVTATASDNSSVSQSADFKWVVKSGNAGPAMTNPGAQTFAEGNDVALTISPTTTNVDTPAYFQISGQPSGIVIDPQTGVISGTLDYVAAEAQTGGNYPVVVTVTDSAGKQTGVNFTWHINHVVSVPVITKPADQSASPGDSVDITVTAADPDGDSLTYDATGLPNGLKIDKQTGEITGTVADDASTSTVTVTAEDSQGNQATPQTFTMTIAANADTVTLTGELQLEAAINQGIYLNYATFTDTDPNSTPASFIAKIDWADGNGFVPAKVIGPKNGLFQVGGTHTFTSKGNHSVSIEVNPKNGTGGSDISTVDVGDLMANIKSTVFLGSFKASDFSDTNPSGFAVNGGLDDNVTAFSIVPSGDGYDVYATADYPLDELPGGSGGVFSDGITIKDTGNSSYRISTSGKAASPPITAR